MGKGEGDGGVPHGDLLVRFSEAVLEDDGSALSQVRDQIRAQMGEAALVDTAAVAALFNAIDRVADATGIPLESWKAEQSADFRADLGIDEFESMSHRPAYE